MELVEEGQCEAWCWTHRERERAVRRCTQDGAFDGLHAAVLCTLHANLTRVCLSEREATERRRVAHGHPRAASKQFDKPSHAVYGGVVKSSYGSEG